jgi:hypothetical protein
MTDRLAAIRQRRDAMVARAEAQRQTLHHIAQRWQRTFSLADTGLTLAREVRSHWMTVAAGTTLLTWMGRGRLGVWIGRVWMGWSLFRSLHDPRPRRQP